MRTLAFIPAKDRSTRFPAKNLAPCHGVPLVVRAARIANEGVALGLFDEAVVYHDGINVREAVREAHLGAVAVEWQPQDLREQEPSPPVIRVLQRWLNEREQAKGDLPDAVCVLWPTSPLRTLRQLVEAYRLLEPGVDAVLSVTQAPVDVRRLCSIDDDRVGLLDSFNWRVKAWIADGTAHWVRTAWVRGAKGFYDSGQIRPYRVPREASADIDSPFDLEYAEWLLSRRTT